MKLALGVVLLFVLPQAEQAQPTGVPEPSGLSLADGLLEVERLCGEGLYDRALAVADEVLVPTDFLRWRRRVVDEGSVVVAPLLDLCDPALDWLGLNGHPEELRAEVHFAKGIVRLESESLAGALDSFETALAGAGAGDLRLAATYDLGLTSLLEGEEWRAQLLQLEGKMPGLIAAAQQPADVPTDPRKSARAAYERAKEQLVRRMRMDWRDANTRANVELVQRRLKWLDELEQQQPQQDPKDQQQPEQQPGDEQQDDPSSSDENSEPNDQDAQNPEQDANQQQNEDESQEPEPGDTPEEENADERESDQEPPPAEASEAFLTREEVQRLLDRLRVHEEEGADVKARLYQKHRRRVDRDW